MNNVHKFLTTVVTLTAFATIPLYATDDVVKLSAKYNKLAQQNQQDLQELTDTHDLLFEQFLNGEGFINRKKLEETLTTITQAGHAYTLDKLLSHVEIQLKLSISHTNNLFVIAAYLGHDNILKILMQNEIMQPRIDDISFSSALVHATQEDHPEVIDFLISHPDIYHSLFEE